MFHTKIQLVVSFDFRVSTIVQLELHNVVDGVVLGTQCAVQIQIMHIITAVHRIHSAVEMVAAVLTDNFVTTILIHTSQRVYSWPWRIFWQQTITKLLQLTRKIKNYFAAILADIKITKGLLIFVIFC